MTWIYILIFFFTLLFFAVNRKEVFNLGSDARLICSNRTQTKAIFVIWDIELKHKTCKISFSNEGQNINTCDDGKSIQNSTDQSFLHIPNFSASDVGAYRCESAYTGGNENYKIAVGVTAPPAVSAWLERRDKKIVAVCRAERGNPAANISWSVIGNHSVTQQNDRDGFVTVKSELEVPEYIDPENLTCIVQHQFWKREKTFIPKFRGQAFFRLNKTFFQLKFVIYLFILCLIHLFSIFFILVVFNFCLNHHAIQSFKIT
uniref:Ig-like domain-containing protein n=1 Tax=Xiphophorus couchianus TaxID=32473 RepID=A0A3B5MPC6_9TELE